MTNLTALFSDDYNFETLVLPVAAIVIPLYVGLAALGFNINLKAGTVIVGVEVVTLPIWLAANSVREAGKRLEKQIFGAGFPTTVRLRLREGDNDYQKQSLRALVEQASGIKLLSARAEKGNPTRADQTIERAINILKEGMRDSTKYLLLRRELKSYGYWRNIVAIRNYGVASAATGLIASIISFWVENPSAASTILSVVAFLICLVMLGFWLFGARPATVTRAGERYADQFFRSLDNSQK